MVSLRLVSSLLFAATVVQATSHEPEQIYELKHGHADRAQRLAKRQENRVYNLVHSSEGQTFFDDWNFMTFADPTHGLVNYTDADTAFSQGLAYVREDGVAIMRVDNTSTLQSGQNRNSVRIHTKESYGKSLFIADILQMPYGPSVWPAYWSNGDNWPAGGEIDIIEGTQNSTANQSTLHTEPGCTLDTGRFNANAAQLVSDATFTGEAVGSNECNAYIENNSGCGIKNADPNSYGFGFNSAGGGVYATLWDDDGIRIWFFARGSIPDDITNQVPNPATWSAPIAFFSTATCSMDQFFTNQTFIFNITLCGDLANATFGQDGTPGTCQDWVTDPSHFRLAMWKVNYFRVYQ